MEDDDLQIIDVENYKGGSGGDNFSHSQLVMISMRKCIDAGSKEMREGYYNEKSDRMGNTARIYVPDTRKEFIESVKTLKMTMSDDLDAEAEKNIKEFLEALDKKYKSYVEMEKNEWEKSNNLMKKSWIHQGYVFHEGMLHRNKPFYVLHLIESVDTYRNVFAELKKLTKRLDYYREEFYEA